MIARHETHLDKTDIWSALSAPLPPGVISWRQDGRPISRDGRHIARFVAYIEANTVRERLDAVVPGEWDLTLELLPPVTGLDEDANQGACSFKARLQILGVIREDVGTGKDYKQAATDAFKRAAVRFGIAHELYAYEQNWVQMDGDGKYAKPIEDSAVTYARRYGRPRVESAPAEPAHPPEAVDVRLRLRGGTVGRVRSLRLPASRPLWWRIAPRSFRSRRSQRARPRRPARWHRTSRAARSAVGACGTIA